MSTYHVARIKVAVVPEFKGRPLKDWAQPGRTMGFSGVLPHRLNVAARLWLSWRWGLSRSFEEITPRYWGVMAAYFTFHFSQFLPVALFPIFWVREIHLSDGTIGGINALFYVTMLIFSPFLERLTRRFGNHRLSIIGAILLGIYPLLTGLSTDATLVIAANIIGGGVWAILSGALVNRLLEVIPEAKRPSHLALYNVALNVAVLSSTLIGPILGDLIGLREALFIAAVVRGFSGLALARWG